MGSTIKLVRGANDGTRKPGRTPSGRFSAVEAYREAPPSADASGRHRAQVLAPVERRGRTGCELPAEYTVRLGAGARARVKVDGLGADRAWIDWVYVPPSHRGSGVGGLLLRAVLEDADRLQVRLGLEARACGTLDQAALERWYAGFGFEATGRQGEFGPIFERAPALVRRPRYVARAA